MRYIGIDVSKKTLDVFFPPSTFKKVSNDEKGFTEIFSFLEKDDILGVESTGSYHHALKKISRKFLLQFHSRYSRYSAEVEFWNDDYSVF